MISHEQARLAEYLAGQNPTAIASFISATPKLQRELMRFNADMDVATLVGNLESGDRRHIGKARDFLDGFLEVKSGRLPTANLPRRVRRLSSRDEFSMNFKLAGHNLTQAGKAIANKNLDKAIVFGTAALTETVAGTLSGMGLTVRERKLAMATGVSMIFANLMMGSQAQAAISQSDINAALNDFNAAPHSDTLHITITGSNSLSGDFNSAIVMPSSDYLLSPYMVKKINEDPQARQYLTWMTQAAAENGLDPVLFSNQLFRETMHFKHSVIYGPDESPAGARGFGQFMPSTGPQYGLATDADYFDPQKSIFAAAKMMKESTLDYGGDQILAMAAYNGGADAVTYVKEQLGHSDITGEEWLDFMNKRYAEVGVTSKTAWHVETRAYIADITGQDWKNDYRKWAEQLQGSDAMEYVAKINETMTSNPALQSIDLVVN